MKKQFGIFAFLAFLLITNIVLAQMDSSIPGPVTQVTIRVLDMNVGFGAAGEGRFVNTILVELSGLSSIRKDEDPMSKPQLLSGREFLRRNAKEIVLWNACPSGQTEALLEMMKGPKDKWSGKLLFTGKVKLIPAAEKKFIPALVEIMLQDLPPDKQSQDMLSEAGNPSFRMDSPGTSISTGGKNEVHFPSPFGWVPVFPNKKMVNGVGWASCKDGELLVSAQSGGSYGDWKPWGSGQGAEYGDWKPSFKMDSPGTSVSTGGKMEVHFPSPFGWVPVSPNKKMVNGVGWATCKNGKLLVSAKMSGGSYGDWKPWGSGQGAEYGGWKPGGSGQGAEYGGWKPGGSGQGAEYGGWKPSIDMENVPSDQESEDAEE